MGTRESLVGVKWTRLKYLNCFLYYQCKHSTNSRKLKCATVCAEHLTPTCAFVNCILWTFLKKYLLKIVVEIHWQELHPRFAKSLTFSGRKPSSSPLYLWNFPNTDFYLAFPTTHYTSIPSLNSLISEIIVIYEILWPLLSALRTLRPVHNWCSPTKMKLNCSVWRSYVGGYEKYYLLGCDTV